MKGIAPIHDETAYERAVVEIRRLWGAEPGTPAADRLEVLMVLVDAYENEHHSIGLPDPIEAIRIRMEDKGLDRSDLCKMLGISTGRASEILNRRRRLTVEMMRILSAQLGLSEACLLQDYELSPHEKQCVAA